MVEGNELVVVGDLLVPSQEDREGSSSGRDECEESWEESCLQKFSQCMGLSIKGFEDEFLEPMQKVGQRRCKGKGKGKGKGAGGSSSFDRELKKLEWNVKDRGKSKMEAQGKGARGTDV